LELDFVAGFSATPDLVGINIIVCSASWRTLHRLVILPGITEANFIGQMIFFPDLSLKPALFFAELFSELQFFAAQVAKAFGV